MPFSEHVTILKLFSLVKRYLTAESHLGDKHCHCRIEINVLVGMGGFMPNIFNVSVGMGRYMPNIFNISVAMGRYKPNIFNIYHIILQYIAKYSS